MLISLFLILFYLNSASVVCPKYSSGTDIFQLKSYSILNQANEILGFEMDSLGNAYLAIYVQNPVAYVISKLKSSNANVEWSTTTLMSNTEFMSFGLSPDDQFILYADSNKLTKIKTSDGSFVSSI
jgi:hypothetical protein